VTQRLFPVGTESSPSPCLSNDKSRATSSTRVPSPFSVLSDAEVDEICAGLKQNAAKARYLRDVLHVAVMRKPNGRPLVLRSEWERRAETTHGLRVANVPRWSKAR
jgi:hypothetical protein